MSLKPANVSSLIRSALREDLGSRGDVTSIATIPDQSKSIARIVAREPGIFCGEILVKESFKALDRNVKIRFFVRDGGKIKRGQTICEVRGRTRALLSAERTALNLIQRMSGIATHTGEFVRLMRKASSKVRLLDTRKTTPLLRVLEKYAVTCGGGTNHRFGLYDMVLIKDNHLAAVAQDSHQPVLEAVKRARKKWPKLKVEVECDTLRQVAEAVASKADIILLDNMSPKILRQAVKIVAGRAKTEASGGINLKTISKVAATGVDFVSVGSLTHSAKALDISLDFVG